MSRLRRTGAFVAVWRQVRAATRTGPPLGARLRALPRLVVASVRGRPRYDRRWRLLLMGLAALYVVAPVDLLPEVPLGPAGLVDDVVVVTWLAGAVLSETGRFLVWEQANAGPIGPDPLRSPA